MPVFQVPSSKVMLLWLKCVFRFLGEQNAGRNREVFITEWFEEWIYSRGHLDMREGVGLTQPEPVNDVTLSSYRKY